MSEKLKNFPLPLSSVMGTSQPKRLTDSDYRLREIAPQTAVRNIAQNRGAQKPGTEPALRPKATPLPQLPVASKNQPAPIRGAIAMAEKIAAQGVKDPMVLGALATVPRHLFVESGLSQQAYVDTSLPIGHQQTISRPYTVARMIEAVRVDTGGKKLASVLEIGTGCGYQAAVLSQVADMVYSIERIRALHELAKNNLRQLRIPNLRLHYGDGMLGLPQVAPFDAIVIAAAGLEVPEALFLQLAVGGYMIAPIGNEKQTLQLTKRTGERQWQSVMLEDCHFVPLRQGII
ncbi:MAG: protein-L-isoaspartate(D-aspartate) O-methyltransferase [Oxalobacter sp.]|nr:protein-L-isoaspartate(D-aspartate) O-methyltransferase [Oxalobacter sp.]